MTTTPDPPLVRGTLRGPITWLPCEDDPTRERAEATLTVRCCHCGKLHSHAWDPGHDPEQNEPRGASCGRQYRISAWPPGTPGHSRHQVRPGRALIRKRITRPAPSPAAPL